jgi:hypothetical protein
MLAVNEVSNGEETDGEEDDTVADKDYFGDDLFGEIIRAMYAARYLAPVFMVVAFIVGYHVVIAPFARNGALGRNEMISHDDLKMVRPMLANHEMESLKLKMREGETNFWMPEPSRDQVKLRFHAAASKKGTHQPPELFYQGVVFGLTDQNSHDLAYTQGRGNEHAVDKSHRLLVEEVTGHRGENDMLQDLEHMRPKPTAVMRRHTMYNVTGWEEHGFAVYFSYEDLKKQGKWSTDKLQPFKRVLEDVMVIARHYRQVYVMAWYPHAFGKTPPLEDNLDDPHRHTTVLQQVIPTRTGLHGIKSTVPVWMSAVNHTEPEARKRTLRDHVYTKEWSDEDHWQDYKPGGKNYRRLSAEETARHRYHQELIKPHGTKAVHKGQGQGTRVRNIKRPSFNAAKKAFEEL